MRHVMVANDLPLRARVSLGLVKLTVGIPALETRSESMKLSSAPESINAATERDLSDQRREPRSCSREEEVGVYVAWLSSVPPPAAEPALLAWRDRWRLSVRTFHNRGISP